MPETSFIYSNINYYRFVMSLLYKGKYYKRFKPVLEQVSGRTVTEICFGDTVIAEHCRKKSIVWAGIDINATFVENAVKNGFAARQGDILTSPFPPADTCIITGSLYHFHKDLESLFVKMLGCAPCLIISEPVVNLSSRNGIIGKLAKASADVNGEQQTFRFTEATLLAAIETLSKKLKFEYKVTGRFSKDIIVVIKK